MLITTEEYLCGWFRISHNAYGPHFLRVYDVPHHLEFRSLSFCVSAPLFFILSLLLSYRENPDYLLLSDKYNEISTVLSTLYTQRNSSLLSYSAVRPDFLTCPHAYYFSLIEILKEMSIFLDNNNNEVLLRKSYYSYQGSLTLFFQTFLNNSLKPWHLWKIACYTEFEIRRPGLNLYCDLEKVAKHPCLVSILSQAKECW